MQKRRIHLSVAFCCTLAVLAFTTGTPVLANDVHWWNAAWKCRRHVDVFFQKDVPESRQTGYVRFRSAGLARPDGSDIRVVCGGREIPFVLACVQQDDCFHVLFPLQPGTHSYEIYYGNPDAKAPHYDWAPQVGLFLETRRYNGGSCQTWQAMQDLIARSGPPFGFGPVGKIFDGFNRFGPSDDYVSIYRGWLKCPANGAYTFATTSDEASFVFIDGKLVVKWPGWHGAVRDARYSSWIDLRAGFHKVEYYHVERTGSQAAVLAWTRPDNERFEVIDESFFPKASIGRLRGLDIRGQPVAPDFTCEHVADYFLDGRPLVFVRFRDASSLDSPKPRVAAWDFGDGLRSFGSSAEHVYMLEGDYTIRLEIKSDAGQYAINQKLRVGRDWSQQAKPPTDDPAPFVRVVRDYDFAKVDAKALPRLAAFFRKVSDIKSLIKVGNASVARRKEIPDRQLADVALTLATAYREDQKNPKKAVQVLQTCLADIKELQPAAELQLLLGDIYLFDLGKEREALRAYGEIILTEDKIDPDTARRANVRIGDIYREKGNYDKAFALYHRAHALKPNNLPPQKEAVQIGAFARSVEEFLRRKEFDEAFKKLDEWAWEYPEEKLRGHWSLLYAQTAMALGQYDKALAELQTFLKVNPRSSFAPKAALTEARCYLALNDKDKAVEVLQHVAKDYPDSKLQDVAKAMILAITNPQPKREGQGEEDEKEEVVE